MNSLRNNANLMAYKRFRDNGWPIGSGPVAKVSTHLFYYPQMNADFRRCLIDQENRQDRKERALIKSYFVEVLIFSIFVILSKLTSMNDLNLRQSACICG